MKGIVVLFLTTLTTLLAATTAQGQQDKRSWLERTISGRTQAQLITIQRLIDLKNLEGTAIGRLAAYCRLWEVTLPLSKHGNRDEFHLEFETEFDPLVLSDFTMPTWIYVPGRGYATPEYGGFLGSFTKAEQAETIRKCLSDPNKANLFNYSINRYRTAFLARSLAKVTLGWGTAIWTGWIRGGIQTALTYLSTEQLVIYLVEQRKAMIQLVNQWRGKPAPTIKEIEDQLKAEAMAKHSDLRTKMLVLKKAELKESLRAEEAPIASALLCNEEMKMTTANWIVSELRKYNVEPPANCH